MLSSDVWVPRGGRFLAPLWAFFWIWFGIASGIGEGLSPAGVILHGAVPGLVFLAVAVLSWRSPAFGGAALIVVGLLVTVAYPILFSRFPVKTVLAVLLTLALPPFAAGIMLLVRRHKPPASAASRG